MAAPYLGAKHWIGFKKQAVAGTAETTVTNFFASEKIKMDANMDMVERKAYISTGVALPPKVGWISPNGSATMEVHASQPHPFYFALGTDAVSTPSGSVKLHSITDGGAPVICTVEGNKVFQNDKQADACINKWTLNFQTGEKATLDIEWFALSHTNDATITSTPTFTTDPLVCTTATITVGGAVRADVKGGSITWDGQLGQLPTLIGTNGGQPSVIRREAPPIVTGKFDLLDYPKADLATMIAGTSFAVIVEVTGDVISTTYHKFIRVTLPACQFTGGLPGQEVAAETITGSAEFTAFYDTSTSKQILVEAQNTITVLTS